ncbi:hypothetical protein DSO57_1015504 [Entomophthora muscae]|uniref:Uncharacterized protein n=1 Tax=Entomophthora muscae TaxID=34485 RepID=A0ACC2URF7_9FUNG|nr:hypothetical protein DSO57_1015504 [Entomophthora muscae]
MILSFPSPDLNLRSPHKPLSPRCPLSWRQSTLLLQKSSPLILPLGALLGCLAAWQSGFDGPGFLSSPVVSCVLPLDAPTSGHSSVPLDGWKLDLVSLAPLSYTNDSRAALQRRWVTWAGMMLSSTTQIMVVGVWKNPCTDKALKAETGIPMFWYSTYPSGILVPGV